MQKVQRWLHPVCTCTKARVRSAKPENGTGRTLFSRMMSETNTGFSALPPERASATLRHCAASSFSALPSTASVSGICAKACASVCAAQPVTISGACGCSRLALRMACRAWRCASAVTAQVFTITTSASPACAASRRMASDS